MRERIVSKPMYKELVANAIAFRRKMTNIEYDLKEILTRLEGRFDKLESKIDKLGTDVADLKIKMAEDFGSLRSDMTESISTLRSDTTESIGTLRSDMTESIGTLRSDTTENSSSLRSDLVRVETTLKSEIEVLSGNVDNIVKRIDTQEFINRGVIIGLILAVLGGFAKVFGLTN